MLIVRVPVSTANACTPGAASAVCSPGPRVTLAISIAADGVVRSTAHPPASDSTVAPGAQSGVHLMDSVSPWTMLMRSSPELASVAGNTPAARTTAGAVPMLRKAAGVDVGSNRPSPAERRQSPLAGSLVRAARKSVPALSRWAATAPDSTTSRSGPGMTRLATTAPGRYVKRARSDHKGRWRQRDRLAPHQWCAVIVRRHRGNEGEGGGDTIAPVTGRGVIAVAVMRRAMAVVSVRMTVKGPMRTRSSVLSSFFVPQRVGREPIVMSIPRGGSRLTGRPRGAPFWLHHSMQRLSAGRIVRNQDFSPDEETVGVSSSTEPTGLDPSLAHGAGGGRRPGVDPSLVRM